MANAQVSAQEQLLLELINRARLDPQGEAARMGIGLNAGLEPGTISSRPLAPLAFSADLNEAAASHSGWMLSTDRFSHFAAGGSDAGDRIVAAGYPAPSTWGENIAMVPAGSVPTAAVTAMHRNLFLSATHRENLFGNFREVGLGLESGSYGGSQVSLLTEVFASSGTRTFIAGVAYNDRDDDRFYDVGEGRGGIAFDLLADSAGAVATQAAGGYALRLPSGLGEEMTVRVRTDSTTMTVRLDATGGNLKLDVADGTVLMASTDMELGTGGRNARLLGAGALSLDGNGAANHLAGNRGANDIAGHGGGDTLSGLSGHDRLWGHAGHDRLMGGNGSDRLTGGEGNDVLFGGAGGDSFVFVDGPGSTTGWDRIKDLGSGDRIVIGLQGPLPSEWRWEDSHISATTGGWVVRLDDGSRIMVEDVTRTALEDALILA